MRLNLLKKIAFILCAFLFSSSLVFAQGVEVAEKNNEPVVQKDAEKNNTAPFNFGGYIWIDTGYMKSTNANGNEPDLTRFVQAGRLVLAVDYRKEFKGFYAEAKAEFLGHVDELAEYKIDTLDSYIKFGSKLWDFQIGRFLAWELYHKGQGLELYTDEDKGAIDGPDLYELDFTRGHTNGVGQAAFHLFPVENLKIEVAGIYGEELNANYYGFRPLVDFFLWKVQLVVGAEYVKSDSIKSNSLWDASKWGYGGRIQFNSDLITAGFNYTHAETNAETVEGLVDTENSYKLDSMGGFMDIDFWRNSIGLGYHYTIKKTDRGDEYSHIQPFVSYLFRLPVEGLSIKFVAATAIADVYNTTVGDEYTNDMYSGRIRVRYDFE